MRLFSAECTSKARLDGKIAIVTGANTGIGKVTTRDFYKRGARVIMACRNTEKAEEAAADIKKVCEGEKGHGTLVIVKLDLADLESVKACAEYVLKTENRIDLLINNAGIMFCPKSKTKDGFEMPFGTNHLGPFLFTLLLLPMVIKSTPARIVNVASLAHVLFRGPMPFYDLNWEKRSYGCIQAYCQSKLANVLFTKELTRRLLESKIEGVTTYSLHPGSITTELGRHLDSTFVWGAVWFYKHILKLFFKTPYQGAQTTIHCAVDENAGKETGLYYSECAVTEPSTKAKNAESAKRLWDVSVQMVGLDQNYNPFLAK